MPLIGTRNSAVPLSSIVDSDSIVAVDCGLLTVEVIFVGTDTPVHIEHMYSYKCNMHTTCVCVYSVFH